MEASSRCAATVFCCLIRASKDWVVHTPLFSCFIVSSRYCAIVWAKKNGNELKGPVLGRYTSTTVFLSLLFSSEMSVIYSPSKPADAIRAALEASAYDTIEYWTGSVLCIAVRSCAGELRWALWRKRTMHLSNLACSLFCRCTDPFLCSWYVVAHARSEQHWEQRL